MLRHRVADPPAGIGAENVCGANDGQSDGSEAGVEAFIGQERGQVNGDGGDVKAADEKAGGQQKEARIFHRLGKRACNPLFGMGARMRGRVAALGKGERQRRHQRGGSRHDPQRRHPARRFENDMGVGKRRELPDGAAHGREPKSRGPLVGGSRPRDDAENGGEAGSAYAKTNQRSRENDMASA